MAPNLRNMRKAIREEGLDGWLFCNFHHRDKLSDSILGIQEDTVNSRLWLYAVPAGGEPFKLTHAVEPGVLEGLPGSSAGYISREDLISALKSLGGKRWGAHMSDTLTAVSYLDAGTASTLTQAGLILLSAAALVQRFRGLLDAAGIVSHEKAVAELRNIVDLVWEQVKKAHADKRPLYEGELRTAILEEMAGRNLGTSHPPIVAAGVNSGNPHYDFSGEGARIREGDVIQLDLWAKEQAGGAVYGDISWVGVFSSKAPEPAAGIFAGLVDARERAYGFIEAELAAGRRPSGSMVDQKTRDLLTALGYGKALKHRTGHGIDTECHGSGVNIDGVEFPDPRLLLDGSCFSLEPGVYFSDFGLRTEIDVYINNGKPVISGHKQGRQFALLTC
jgi:Xaa-Pro aminopeptidase